MAFFSAGTSREDRCHAAKSEYWNAAAVLAVDSPASRRSMSLIKIPLLGSWIAMVMCDFCRPPMEIPAMIDPKTRHQTSKRDPR